MIIEGDWGREVVRSTEGGRRGRKLKKLSQQYNDN